MAKVVQVIFKEGEEWQDVEVPNFYDPEKHHTVRFGANDKRNYAAMKMPDGNVYDKINKKWKGTERILPTETYKLNIGCGKKLMPGYVNIDLNTECDLNIDLEKAELPFADNSVTDVNADHVLEHITNLVPLMNEIHRVLRPNGVFNITVPVYPHPEAFQDPTHVRFFTVKSFSYFHKDSFLFNAVGESYGIRPFSHIVQQPDNNGLRVQLRK